MDPNKLCNTQTVLIGFSQLPISFQDEFILKLFSTQDLDSRCTLLFGALFHSSNIIDLIALNKLIQSMQQKVQEEKTLKTDDGHDTDDDTEMEDDDGDQEPLHYESLPDDIHREIYTHLDITALKAIKTTNRRNSVNGSHSNSQYMVDLRNIKAPYIPSDERVDYAYCKHIIIPTHLIPTHLRHYKHISNITVYGGAPDPRPMKSEWNGYNELKSLRFIEANIGSPSCLELLTNLKIVESLELLSVENCLLPPIDVLLPPMKSINAFVYRDDNNGNNHTQSLLLFDKVLLHGNIKSLHVHHPSLIEHMLSTKIPLENIVELCIGIRLNKLVSILGLIQRIEPSRLGLVIDVNDLKKDKGSALWDHFFKTIFHSPCKLVKLIFDFADKETDYRHNLCTKQSKCINHVLGCVGNGLSKTDGGDEELSLGINILWSHKNQKRQCRLSIESKLNETVDSFFDAFKNGKVNVKIESKGKELDLDLDLSKKSYKCEKWTEYDESDKCKRKCLKYMVQKPLAPIDVQKMLFPDHCLSFDTKCQFCA
eukprot:39708_1